MHIRVGNQENIQAVFQGKGLGFSFIAFYRFGGRNKKYDT